MKLTEISIEMIAKLEPLFPGHRLAMVMRSIRSHNTSARLWSLHPEDGTRLILLWDKGNNVFYAAGEDTSEEALSALEETVALDIRAQALSGSAAYFSARALSEALTPLVQRSFGKFLNGAREKLLYVYPNSSIEDDWPVHAEGIRFTRMDRRFFEEPRLRHTDSIEAEIRWMWPAVDRYLSAGWGYAAVQGDNAVCWCTAEYVSEHSCGIGIETIPQARNKGIATLAAARFVAECLTRGCRPYWECGAENTASLRIAEKLGFELAERASFHVGRFG